MLDSIVSNINGFIGDFIDWLTQDQIIGALLSVMALSFVLEVLTGFPSWYLGRLFNGLKVFILEYVLMGLV